MTVNELIEDVARDIPFEYMLDEYNHIVREVCLMLPEADAVMEMEASDGKLDTGLHPRQIKRIFAGNHELIPASHALIMLLPHARLYHAAKNTVYVTVSGVCKVLYRTVPNEVTPYMALSAEVFGDECVRLLVRAYLERCAYCYIGDFESADAAAADYNARLEDYKRVNGVSA